MQVLVPTVSAITTYEGRQVQLIRGKTTVHAGHPITRGREGMFEPQRIDYPLEDADGEAIQQSKPKRGAKAAA